MRKITKALLSVMVLVMAMSLAACSSGSRRAANPTVAAIQAYADPATQTTLQGLSEDSLAKYTQYADAQFKAAVTQDVFDKTYAQINSQLGTFVSITFLRTEAQSGYTIVHYRAKFTKGEAGIRMVFDQDHLVAGQWFE